MSARAVFAIIVVVSLGAASAVHGIDLPTGFEEVEVLADLSEPSGIRFSPDGRLFIAERIQGALRVATYDAVSDTWTLAPTPFYTFDIPHDGSGTPVRHRSSGLRDFVFDPDFATNGYIYALYMKHDPRHNRVVRITASAADPNVAAAGSELLLIDLPFNDSESSGSHNGGGMVFGSDGMLYIATGDGWNGGDLVQSLSTLTGKILRVAPDGTIPADNPFFTVASGDYRAIYALGLRNPFSMSRHPVTGQVIVNECNGPSKASIAQVEPAANFGHQGYGGIGNSASPWGNASVASNKLITGGAWYPEGGIFGAEYEGKYFTTLWGGNGDAVGAITTLASIDDPTAELFATEVGSADCPDGDDLKPITIRVGPDGHLYYALTNYESECGSVCAIRFTGQGPVAAPVFTPTGGWSATPVDVTLATATAGAEIRFTTDGTEPIASSPLYSGPLDVDVATTLRARAFLTGSTPSPVAEASFVIGDNLSAVTLPGVTTPGLRYELVLGAFDALPNFDASTPVDIGTVSGLDLSPSSGTTDFALRYTGFLEIATTGVYDFTVESDDRSRLRIGGILVAHDDLAELSTVTGSVGLEAGWHPFALEYGQHGGTASLSVSYAGPGVPSQPLPDSVFVRPQNLPPVTNAGADQVADLFELVELNGSASSDPDSDELLLTWYWQQLSGPSADLLGDDDAVTWFVAETPGLYEFELTVSDGESDVSDTVVIEVTSQVSFDLENGLVAHWRFDDSVGSIAVDATGSHDGLLANGPTWTSGWVDGGLAFDGVDDRVDVPPFDVAGDQLTIAFWFRADDFDQMDGRFISKADGVQPDDHTWMVSTIDDTGLRFRVRTGGTTTTLASSTGVLTTDQWTHVVARYDGQTMQLYRDGELVAETAKSGPIDADPDRHIALGDQPQGTRPFDGVLDDVRVYQRAVTPSEIVALANCSLSPDSQPDCNGNGLPDPCDLSLGFSADQDLDGVPDECSDTDFVRGDVNADGAIDISDPVWLLGYLFIAGPTPSCLAAADFDANGTVEISDAVQSLGYTFAQGPPPAAPFPDCGSRVGASCSVFFACP